MRPNVTASHVGSRISVTRWAIGGTLFVLLGASAAYAGAEVPTMCVIGGTGIPGGTVNVTIALSDDSSDPNLAACAAELEIDFDADILSFPGPTMGGSRPPRCMVEPRLSATHVIQGPGQFEPGVVDAEIFANPAGGGNSPLGNGSVATCAFNVDIGAPVGTTALMIDAAQSALKRCNGMSIAPVSFDCGTMGDVVIALPTPTFTVTSTPTTQATGTATATRTSGTPPSTTTATATRTSDGGGTPTHTVSATSTVVATSTRTTGPSVTSTVAPTNTTGPTGTSTVGVPPTSTRTSGSVGTPTRTAAKSTQDDGCNIVAPAQSGSDGMLALLLAPALLLWARRRRF